MVHVVYRDYGVRRKCLWCWWDARTKRLGGGRGLPRLTENRVHTLAVPSKGWVRKLGEGVHARVYIVVEMVGCYVGENEQPAVN